LLVVGCWNLKVKQKTFQLEIKGGNPLKISGKNRRKKSEISGFSAFTSNWVVNRLL
jgi:hypothetical protein